MIAIALILPSFVFRIFVNCLLCSSISIQKSLTVKKNENYTIIIILFQSTFVNNYHKRKIKMHIHKQI